MTESASVTPFPEGSIEHTRLLVLKQRILTAGHEHGFSPKAIISCLHAMTMAAIQSMDQLITIDEERKYAATERVVSYIEGLSPTERVYLHAIAKGAAQAAVGPNFTEDDVETHLVRQLFLTRTVVYDDINKNHRSREREILRNAVRQLSIPHQVAVSEIFPHLYPEE